MNFPFNYLSLSCVASSLKSLPQFRQKLGFFSVLYIPRLMSKDPSLFSDKKPPNLPFFSLNAYAARFMFLKSQVLTWLYYFNLRHRYAPLLLPLDPPFLYDRSCPLYLGLNLQDLNKNIYLACRFH